MMNDGTACNFFTISMRKLHVYISTKAHLSLSDSFTSHVTTATSFGRSFHPDFDHMSGKGSNSCFPVLVSTFEDSPRESIEIHSCGEFSGLHRPPRRLDARTYLTANC
jgi:hypothetical protein